MITQAVFVALSSLLDPVILVVRHDYGRGPGCRVTGIIRAFNRDGICPAITRTQALRPQVRSKWSCDFAVGLVQFRLIARNRRNRTNGRSVTTIRHGNTDLYPDHLAVRGPQYIGCGT